MSESIGNDPLEPLRREVRQRLEALRRAGISRIPRPVEPPANVKSKRIAVPSPSPVPAAPQPAEPSGEPALTPFWKIVNTPVPPPAPAATLAKSLFGEPTIEGPKIAAEDRPRLLAELAVQVAACTRCPLLAETRTQTVFGSGSPTARLFFVGEAPGAEEDRTGEPFVGPAGKLLTDMITKGMGLTRAEVYIANILKSRPPNNRNPLPDEARNCLPYLQRQIEIVRPEFLCLLGKIAASHLLETALPVGKLRGKWHRYRGISTIVTYHPSYLLREPTAKKDAWDDLQRLMQAMGLKIPTKRKGG